MMFLKFGSEEFMKDLIYNGTIFMNSIQYFKTLEDQELRGDSYEGVIEVSNSLPGKFEIPSIGYKGKHQGIHLKRIFGESFGNIYSLYCISSYGWKNPLDFSLDKKMEKFGDYCVIIKNNQTFFNLITKKLEELQIKYHHNFINYYDRKTINRKVSLFEKPLEFEYQKEFRFYIDREFSDSFKFNIGNIENIAELVKSEELISTLKLIPKK